MKRKPGSKDAVEGGKSWMHAPLLKKKKNEEEEAAAVDPAPKQFYGCHSCRWSLTGEGCCYCNPMKHEKLLQKKQRLAKELAEALKKGLEKLVEQGMIPAASIEKGEVAASSEKGEAVEATEPNEAVDID